MASRTTWSGSTLEWRIPRTWRAILSRPLRRSKHLIRSHKWNSISDHGFHVSRRDQWEYLSWWLPINFSPFANLFFHSNKLSSVAPWLLQAAVLNLVLVKFQFIGIIYLYIRHTNWSITCYSLCTLGIGVSDIPKRLPGIDSFRRIHEY
jgi:hypothetical protein